MNQKSFENDIGSLRPRLTYEAKDINESISIAYTVKLMSDTGVTINEGIKFNYCLKAAQRGVSVCLNRADKITGSHILCITLS